MITNVTLSTKEELLLQDQKSQEEQCVLKYDNYANLAQDPELKNIFRQNGQKEVEHLNTINQILNGTVPSMGGNSQQQSGQSGQSQQSGQSGQSQQSGQSGQSQQSGQSGQSMQSAQSMQAQQGSVGQSMPTQVKLTDKDMCMDMLSTEKYVSGSYDTAIFEFKDTAVRDALNHIQKEEQQHGESIFKYMQSRGMYSVK